MPDPDIQPAFPQAKRQPLTSMSKRILFITPALSKAGAETQLLKVADFLSLEGHDVLIISLLPKNDYTLDLPSPRIKSLFLRNWRVNFLSNLRELHRAVRFHKPQVTIAFMFIAIIFARLLKLRFRYKLVSSIRASEIPYKWYWPFRMTQGLDDEIVFNASEAKRIFEKKRLVKNIGVIVNNSITVPPVTAKPEFASKKFKWVCVAHFRGEKDYPTLFRAIALLKQKDFEVSIVGHLFGQDWPFEMIKELDIEDKVQLLGFRNDVTAFLENAQGFVVSSFTESMPNAILEAMAHSKLIVASDVGGVRRLVESAACGFCFRQGDAKALAKLMHEVMSMDENTRLSFGRNGRTFVVENFSNQNVMRQWSNVIGINPISTKASKNNFLENISH